MKKDAELIEEYERAASKGRGEAHIKNLQDCGCSVCRNSLSVLERHRKQK